MAAVGEDVYCTLVTTDSYLPGAAVLAHSLKDSGSQKKLACLYTAESLSSSSITELQSLYNYVIPVDRIGNPTPANLFLMNRPDLLYTFTKIHLWRMTQFRKIVYIDSDVVALRAPEELFDLEDDFAAAPDVGWPDAFNTGVMVISPHMGEYWALRTLASAGDSFDGADQGLLNQYYEHRPWKRLSFTYNCTPSANYQYEPAYRYYKQGISMVHFIGTNKPWRSGRSTTGASVAYQELLSRWWAVYDRHFRVSTDEYIMGHSQNSIQNQVKDERDNETKTPDYYASGYPLDSTGPAPPPELPLTEPVDELENITRGLVEPTPTVEQRKFSAPHMEWDATRAAPPAESKPEAANFPTTLYEFNNDPSPFRPPQSYPEPPKDMWFEVPKEKPSKAKALPAIFPWEEREQEKPSRIFVEDQPAPPSPEMPVLDELQVSSDSPSTPTIKVTQHQVPEYGTRTQNAWDAVSGIDEYVRALTAFQKSRGKVEVLFPTDKNTSSVLPPTEDKEPAEILERVSQRRESLILTDFPTEIERPSLPVTPAPRRRPTFWGVERDESDLPIAEGVPDQADWDPNAQLEELRRNSLISPADLKLPLNKKKIPERVMPEASSTITIAAVSTSIPTAGPSTAAAAPEPVFSESLFSTTASNSEANEVDIAPSKTAAP
ncbi:Hypothetical protein R9X50_00129200 [Acrodontium crateriforme]|uniref:glycogenin glucosyltransferase n=1 Tax=Acrodontium crateriforme TaxID=150365 RepID=A0AAQ3M4W5_9PEZI|nr:Hypothetical protein R9X50_00129200 [Acrodontium crateriforme]